MKLKTRQLYRSSSGDVWLLGRDPDSGRVMVVHRANPASGGNVEDVEIDVLGPKRRHTAEAQALVQLIGTLVEDAMPERPKGGKRPADVIATPCT